MRIFDYHWKTKLEMAYFSDNYSVIWQVGYFAYTFQKKFSLHLIVPETKHFLNLSILLL